MNKKEIILKSDYKHTITKIISDNSGNFTIYFNDSTTIEYFYHDKVYWYKGYLDSGVSVNIWVKTNNIGSLVAVHDYLNSHIQAIRDIVVSVFGSGHSVELEYDYDSGILSMSVHTHNYAAQIKLLCKYFFSLVDLDIEDNKLNKVAKSIYINIETKLHNKISEYNKKMYSKLRKYHKIIQYSIDTEIKPLLENNKEYIKSITVIDSSGEFTITFQDNSTITYSPETKDYCLDKILPSGKPIHVYIKTDSILSLPAIHKHISDKAPVILDIIANAFDNSSSSTFGFTQADIEYDKKTGHFHIVAYPFNQYVYITLDNYLDLVSLKVQNTNGTPTKGILYNTIKDKLDYYINVAQFGKGSKLDYKKK